jgi:hypothetical protein
MYFELSIFLEGLSKTKKNLKQYNQCHGRDSKRRYHGCASTLQLRQLARWYTFLIEYRRLLRQQGGVHEKQFA